MVDASEFVKRPRRTPPEKVMKLFRITADRVEWLVKFAEDKGIPQTEIIEAGIDALRKAEQEGIETT